MWKILISILLIVVLSFGVMASSLTGMVSNYLYTQRIREDSLSIEKLATAYAPLFQSGDSRELNNRLLSSAGELGGRLLVVDTDGKVQCDTFSRLNGTRLQVREILALLTGGETTAWGLYTLSGDGVEADAGNTQVIYNAVPIIGTDGMLGVLLYVSGVDEMMSTLDQAMRQILQTFLLVAAAAMAAAILLARLITRPITSLTATIQKMGGGDLSVRAPVKGSGEMRELALSYNTMAEQLESLDKSRNQFVSNASHELKTPLASLKILLESVMYQPDMPQELRTEFMQDMDHEIDRLTGIITDLLTLTQMDNHKLTLNQTSADLSEMTREMIRLLEPMAEKKEQTLESAVEDDVHGVLDRGKMSQVIYNLAENAVKYTPQGGHIRVTLQRKGHQAVWTVEDNGPGIPAADQPHVFERFYRVDKARSRETGGTGLGLSIVRQLVTLHGGEVTLESEEGKGSVFTVTLPIHEEEIG